MNIAHATADDLDAIVDIEQRSFKTPRSRAHFEGELAREWARLDVVRDERGAIIAFSNYWIVVPELSIHVVATHPDHRGKGAGSLLLGQATAVAARLGCKTANLEVRAGNRDAIALYERNGFHTVHVRARYYQDDDEDALVMVRRLVNG